MKQDITVSLIFRIGFTRTSAGNALELNFNCIVQLYLVFNGLSIFCR